MKKHYNHIVLGIGMMMIVIGIFVEGSDDNA